jgi:hypothetical protein
MKYSCRMFSRTSKLRADRTVQRSLLLQSDCNLFSSAHAQGEDCTDENETDNSPKVSKNSLPIRRPTGAVS